VSVRDNDAQPLCFRYRNGPPGRTLTTVTEVPLRRWCRSSPSAFWYSHESKLAKGTPPSGGPIPVVIALEQHEIVLGLEREEQPAAGAKRSWVFAGWVAQKRRAPSDLFRILLQRRSSLFTGSRVRRRVVDATTAVCCACRCVVGLLVARVESSRVSRSRQSDFPNVGSVLRECDGYCDNNPTKCPTVNGVLGPLSKNNFGLKASPVF